MLSRDAASRHTDEACEVRLLAPLDPTLLLNEGNSLCMLERFKEAAAIYGAALALSPAASLLRAMLFSNRAMAHLEMQQAQAALDDFDAALAVLASLQTGQEAVALLADVHRIALAGKSQAQTRRQGMQ